MQIFATILLVLMNLGVITMALFQSVIYSVEYCCNSTSVYETYTNISRIECVLTCLNYNGCFGVVMKDWPKSPGVVESCQLMPNNATDVKRCPYSPELLNYYHIPVDACEHLGFTKYGSKCYKYETGPVIAAKVDAECQKKYSDARAVLPRNQNELDVVFKVLKLWNYNYEDGSHIVVFDYIENGGIIRIKDGSTVTFARNMWHRGEPDIAEEYCVMLWNFEFRDVYCTRGFGYICVMDNKNLLY